VTDGPLTFPDGPRSELEETISRLVRDAQQVLATESRLRSLLKATRLVAEELDLPVVLRRIIEAAVELVGARYGAIGVIASDGSLEQFIHVGLEEERVREIGELPRGRGLLGALIDEQVPIRLDHLRDDPRSSGFPDGHPPMDSFLGVPVRVRNETYGNLYLAEHDHGPFSAEDQELLIALAATAGAAIEHARLYDETRRRQRWAEASAEVTAALLSDESDDSIAVLVDRVTQLSDADLVCVVVPESETELRARLARGELAELAVNTVFDRAGTAPGRALESRQPVLAETAGLPDTPLGPTIAIPLSTGTEIIGALTVSRRVGRERFTEADLRMVADFAAQAGVAMRLAEGRADRQRLAVIEDRGRIARDLHDTVIQRLFGAGLSLQAIAGGVDAATAARIGDQVEILDSAIADIRTAIFAMTSTPDASRPTLRYRILDLFTELSNLFDEAPRLTFSGPVDLMVSVELADDLVAVVREGLTNVARHASATSTSASVSVEDEWVRVEIVDDGVGMPQQPTRSSGTANLAARAAARNGTFELEAREPRGTTLIWSAPVGGRP
jgi:signal transduction histidine kinase